MNSQPSSKTDVFPVANALKRLMKGMTGVRTKAKRITLADHSCRERREVVRLATRSSSNKRAAPRTRPRMTSWGVSLLRNGATMFVGISFSSIDTSWSGVN